VRLFPVVGKRPFPGSRGLYDALPEAEAIAKWQDHPLRTGWGMACGRDSGRWCLDVDEKDGRQGWATLRQLEAKHGQLPETQQALTPTGGGHIHFLWTPECEGLSNSAGRLGEGLDVRAAGGYVLMPGSKHPDGGQYVWEEGHGPGDVPLAPAPRWLLDLLKPRGQSQPLQNPGGYADVAWQGALQQVRQAGNGTRNETLNRAAFNMGRLVAPARLDPVELEQGLLEAAMASGLPELEARGVIARGLADGMGQPRGVVEAPKGPPAWEVLDLATWHGRHYDKPERLVGPFTSGSLSYIYGAPNSNKTWLALEVMRQCEAPSLYVVEEGSKYNIQWRTKALGMPPGFHIAPRNGLKVHDEAALDFIIGKCRELGIRLLVLDPLSDMSDLDEMDQGEMKELRAALRRLVDETGAAVVMLHHSNKAASGPDAQAGFGNMRGSTILAGAADLMLEVRPFKDGFGSEIHMTKARDIAREAPGRINITVADGRATVEWVHGADAREAREEAARAKQVAKYTQADRARELILRAVDMAPGATTRRKVLSLARMSDEGRGWGTLVDSTIDLMLSEGLLQEVPKDGQGGGMGLIRGGSSHA
jgi:hypothetical protein